MMGTILDFEVCCYGDVNALGTDARETNNKTHSYRSFDREV